MISVLSNICLQIIEAMISFYFYESVSHLNKGKMKRIVIILVSYLIMCALNLLFDYNVLVNNIALVFCHFCFSLFLYKQKIGVSLFYPLMFAFLITVTELCTINFITAFSGTNSRAFIDDVVLYTILIVCSKSALFLIISIISNIINKFKADGISDWEFYIYPITLLVVIIIFVIIAYKNELNKFSHILLAISSIVLIFVFIVICILQQQSSRRKAEYMELKTIQQKQDMDKLYFDLLEHQNDELQIFVHDIQKHLQNIYNLSPDSKKTQKYISSLSTDLSDINKIGKTSNKLLDLIINKYDYISEKKHIHFEKDIHTADLSFINDTDLTSIFNNLLDNAIEAAKQSTDRRINLSINNFGNILTISLSNSCDNPPLYKHNKLVSKKTNQGLHGYGLKSINKSVKKYNGDIEFEYCEDEKTFNVSILFYKSL